MSPPEPDIPASVLVVDDHQENRTALRAILSCADYRVVEASSGPQALRSLLQDEEDFAVLLLDVVMPQMDGFELATAIKGRPKTAAVPILFLSAEASDIEFAFKGYRVGAVDYLIKPLVPEMVRAKVAVFVDLYRQRKRVERQSLLLLEAERRESELRLLELHLAGERRLREQAEAAIRARDEFLSIASHELRTPLSSLRLQVEMLLSPRRGADPSFAPAQVRGHLEKAATQIERLSDLVSELLDVSRIKAGRLHIELERVDLAAVAGDVVGRFAGAAARTGSVMSFHSDQAVTGTWDRLRMEQVVTNLLGNALKFGAGRPISVTVSRDGSRARLVVCDHGIGIAPPDIERIFDRYERGASARSYGGLGLGLYIARQIVEAHRGSIRVDSKPEEGSTFVVDLPCEAPSEKTHDEHRERTTERGSCSS